MTELQAVTGWSRHEIRTYVQEGMPYLEMPKGRGGNWLFCIPDCIKWRLARSDGQGTEVLSFEDARNRKMSAEARLAEIELAKAAGQVAEVSLIEQLLEACIVPAKARINSLAAELEALVDDDLHATIRDRVTEALEALQKSAGELPDDVGSAQAA